MQKFERYILTHICDPIENPSELLIELRRIEKLEKKNELKGAEVLTAQIIAICRDAFKKDYEKFGCCPICSRKH
jgi:hypothetical protein